MIQQDWQCTYNVLLGGVSLTIVAVESKITTYSGCVSVALIIQHAKPVHPTILLSVAYLAVHCLPQYIISSTIF
jgi:hypothetical protein